jgi:hypothetical protein
VKTPTQGIDKKNPANPIILRILIQTKKNKGEPRTILVEIIKKDRQESLLPVCR